MHMLPDVGGDTLWASGYEAYDRLSPALRRFLEGLTAEHDGNFFHDVARAQGVPIQNERGSPLNTGTNLRAVQCVAAIVTSLSYPAKVCVSPVIRTHPLTGYKTLFVNKGFTTRIVELAPEESATLLDYLFRHIAENHDIQVRYHWGKDDVAIWDNRCTFHTATCALLSVPRVRG